MNIAFLNSIEKETYGGMEEWIRLVAEGLSAKGHTTTLIGRPDSEYLRRGAAHDNVNRYELNIGGDFHPLIIKKLKKYLAENSVEVLTVNFNKDIRIGGIAARLDKSVKVVWSVGLDITKNKLAHKILTPRLIDRVIVPSQSLKEEITKFGYIDDKLVEVVPICIPDIQRQSKDKARLNLIEKYKMPPDAIISVTSGRLVEQKGHEFLIEAAVDIVKKYPMMRFLLLGNGHLEEFLKQKIDKDNLEDNFIFAGMQDNIELELNGADIMIHPSRKEPFGIAVLEGMRSGVPIVASKVGGIPEVVSENECAYLVEVGDYKSIAKKVTELLDNHDKLETMGFKGRERYEKVFKLDNMIEQLENFYSEVINPVKLTTE